VAPEPIIAGSRGTRGEERIEMTTEELAELFLAHVYDLAEAAPHPNFLFSVNDFAPKLGITDREELQKAITMLGDRGFIILAGMDMFGGISAGITMEGSAFVEKGGETGVIKQYRKDPQTFVRKPLEFLSPSVARETMETVSEGKPAVLFASRTVEAILADMKDILERDNTVAAEVKQDLLSDLATLKIQMGRTVKDRRIIDAVLGNLSAVPSIAPLAAAISGILEATFI
jgi:hypothetical protein